MRKAPGLKSTIIWPPTLPGLVFHARVPDLTHPGNQKVFQKLLRNVGFVGDGWTIERSCFSPRCVWSVALPCAGDSYTSKSGFRCFKKKQNKRWHVAPSGDGIKLTSECLKSSKSESARRTSRGGEAAQFPHHDELNSTTGWTASTRHTNCENKPRHSVCSVGARLSLLLTWKAASPFESCWVATQGCLLRLCAMF